MGEAVFSAWFLLVGYSYFGPYLGLEPASDSLSRLYVVLLAVSLVVLALGAVRAARSPRQAENGVSPDSGQPGGQPDRTQLNGKERES